MSVAAGNFFAKACLTGAGTLSGVIFWL